MTSNGIPSKEDTLIKIRIILENLSQIGSYVKEVPDHNRSMQERSFFEAVTSAVGGLKPMTDLLCEHGKITMKRLEQYQQISDSEKRSVTDRLDWESDSDGDQVDTNW